MSGTTATHRLRLATVLALAVLVGAACGSGTASPRPTTSLPPLLTDSVDDTPAPVPTSRPPTQAPTLPPVGSWPDGWSTSFCALFAEVVVAQELAVDIGRALADDDRDDALALTRELEATAAANTETLAELPDWEPAQAVVTGLTELMDLGQRMGRNYRRYFDDDRQPALQRAEELGGQMRPVAESVVADLGDLADEEGLACPEVEFVLEVP